MHLSLFNSLSFLQLKMELEETESSRAGTPGSMRSEGSDEREPSPIPVVHRLKALTPGLGQCDILTPQVGC